MAEPAARASDIAFGPFELAPGERLLTRKGAPVALGARASEVVSKKELLAQVWPDTTVDEGSLRFAIASLRRALSDGEGGARRIATVAGRGCFVAPVTPKYGNVSLNWLALTPPDLVRGQFNVGESVIKALKCERCSLVR